MTSEECLELVNPEIISQEGEQEGFEGCLSRARHVRHCGTPHEGEGQGPGPPTASSFEVEGEGITARCFCHEIEHLDGHMYY